MAVSSAHYAVVPLGGPRGADHRGRARSTDFGTGALKITPGHDPDDWEIGMRHGLPSISVIGLDGRMTAEAGEFEGMTAQEARAAVIERLKEERLFDRDEDYSHAVSTCYRCGTTIEPLLSLQWFMEMDRSGQAGHRSRRGRAGSLRARSLGRGLSGVD